MLRLDVLDMDLFFTYILLDSINLAKQTNKQTNIFQQHIKGISADFHMIFDTEYYFGRVQKSAQRTFQYLLILIFHISVPVCNQNMLLFQDYFLLQQISVFICDETVHRINLMYLEVIILGQVMLIFGANGSLCPQSKEEASCSSCLVQLPQGLSSRISINLFYSYVIID